MSEAIFGVGDMVQLTGPKGRLNTFQLVEGGRFGSHLGDLLHDEILGLPDGSVVKNQNGVEYLALKPLLSDYVISMPRGAAIVYPKDAAQILVEGDIYPGAKVLEAGVGTGALTSYLLRAIGSEGELTSVERRAEFAEIARANITNQRPRNFDRWRLLIGDLQDQLPGLASEGETFDRVVLDMLAPWECVEAVASALRPGGLLVCYVATVTQLSRTVEEIRARDDFATPESWESMVRSWHVDGLAVRPDHRMIAHTGFLLRARKLAPGAKLPVFKTKRASKSEFSQDDMDTWLPEQLGVRPVSEKKLRKTVRKAQMSAEVHEN